MPQPPPFSCNVLVLHCQFIVRWSHPLLSFAINEIKKKLSTEKEPGKDHSKLN